MILVKKAAGRWNPAAYELVQIINVGGANIYYLTHKLHLFSTGKSVNIYFVEI